MKKLYAYLMIFVMALALIPARPVSAQGDLIEVTLQPDGDSGKDTDLYNNYPDGNGGDWVSLGVGEQNISTVTERSLIEFDFSGLPYDMTIVSAELTLTVKEDLSDNARTMYAYGVTNDWVESTASWNSRKALAGWETPGASGATDVDAGPIGSVSVANNLSAGSLVVMTLTPEAVQVMSKQNYFGFKLQMDVEANDQYQFYSSDDATESNRPKLVIEYTTGTAFVDPGWTCFEGGSIWSQAFPECLPDPPGNTIPVSPYLDSGGNDGLVNYSALEAGEPVSAAVINCEPYPRCINDYPVHYRITYDANWIAAGSTAGTLTAELNIPGGTSVNNSIACGTGTSGACAGIFEGTIPFTSLPANYHGGWNIGLLWRFNFPSSWIVSEHGITWTLYLSLEPFTQNCTDTYIVPVLDTYTIDPLLETPLGAEGAPADDQIYITVPGQTYMVRVEDGPWNDGTDDRTDAAVSFDGETWLTWEDFSLDAVCIDASVIDPENADYQVIYFTATTDTFHIRVADEAEAFSDNSNDLETPFQYVIGIAFERPEEVSCEAQFSYDPLTDTVASVSVHGDVEDTEANNELTEPLEGGGWYGIEVASGTWNETGGADRIDMEFKFSGAFGSPDWQDLTDGSGLVLCVSTDGNTIFVQAPMQTGLILHLRVNDQDAPQDWSDNEGTLGVNIYHATFTRSLGACELQFEVGAFVYHDEVQANATNGKAFAVMLASDGSNIFGASSPLTYGYGLTPGAWYVLDTTDGPWWQTFSGGGYTSNQHYYDVEVKTGNGEWEPFETWEYAECVVDLDGLGHKRVYFQVPDTGGIQYYIKAANASVFGRGSIGWNLYQGMDIGLSGEANSCNDFIYDPEVESGWGSIDATRANGDHILGLNTYEFYAVQIESANVASDPPYYMDSGWFESSGEDELDELQLTVDGTNWNTLPNHPAVLCYYYTPGEDELVFFVRVLQGQAWKMRADSTTFDNNVGREFYRTYLVSAGDNLDPWTSCSDDYTATVPAINEHEWIPPQDEEGVMLMPTLTYTPGNDPDGDGIIYWGDAGLQSGHDYMVETSDGPWYDGEHPEQLYSAQLSSDGGETWYLFKDHPDVICYTKDQLDHHWKAIFHVEDGERWKIRVADTETDAFTDNTGNLSYQLNLVNEFPIDGPGALVNDYDPSAFDVCSQSLVRPEYLTLSEIGSVGNYLSDWIQYINRSLLSYFAWCPRHTNLLISAVQALVQREPLATIAEFGIIQKNVLAEVDSYDWSGGGFEDTSIFSVNSSSGVQNIADRFLPESGEAVSPWEDGGDLVSFSGDTSLPPYYYTCDSIFADYLPSRLRIGTCFASAYWKYTGASFWLQLAIDIGSLFVLWRMLKTSVQSLVYMMTGVRPWTKDGAITVIERVAEGQPVVQNVDRWRTPR